MSGHGDRPASGVPGEAGPGPSPGTARRLIETLSLAPHPEGGWFRELWRAASTPGERARATSIHFLLEAHQTSHWHKVDATEIWLWHAGDPLMLSLAMSDMGPVSHVRLGPDVLGGDAPQHIVATSEWQAATPLPGPCGYTLVSCIVSPAFEFGGFELAPPGWQPGAAPSPQRGPEPREPAGD